MCVLPQRAQLPVVGGILVKFSGWQCFHLTYLWRWIWNTRRNAVSWAALYYHASMQIKSISRKCYDLPRKLKHFNSIPSHTHTQMLASMEGVIYMSTLWYISYLLRKYVTTRVSGRCRVTTPLVGPTKYGLRKHHHKWHHKQFWLLTFITLLKSVGWHRTQWIKRERWWFTWEGWGKKRTWLLWHSVSPPRLQFSSVSALLQV